MEDVQMGMSVIFTREALNFQSKMVSNLINGSIDKGQEMQQKMVPGLAAGGIGSKLNVEA
ncbi:hypothetical protein [uncultured Desulfovibrio sp.]|uniref:hypothetical protein n=1 Tax=uncultured Desulfovibrio sp. TaxID=167968 RepID=UPI00039BBE1F|nr:hypothetical protein [uncultured Desulfovibrio sp.]